MGLQFVLFFQQQPQNKSQFYQILYSDNIVKKVKIIVCAVFYSYIFIPAPPQVATLSWDRWLCVLSWAAGGSSPSLCVRPTQQTWLPTSPCRAWTMLSGKTQHLQISITYVEQQKLRSYTCRNNFFLYHLHCKHIAKYYMFVIYTVFPLT